MARMERYVNGRPVYLWWCFSFQPSVYFTLAKYGQWTGGRRKGRKPRKEDGRVFSVSIFWVFWTLFELVLQEEFPFTESLGSCTTVQMVSADLRKDAASITVNFVSSCTVSQLLGKEIMQTTCGIHLGCPWHSTGSLACSECTFMLWTMTPLN